MAINHLEVVHDKRCSSSFKSGRNMQHPTAKKNDYNGLLGGRVRFDREQTLYWCVQGHCCCYLKTDHCKNDLLVLDAVEGSKIALETPLRFCSSAEML